MSRELPDADRRRLLAAVGAGVATGLAGCGAGGDGTTTASDEVPEQYRTATSIGGQQRNPDALSSKDAVSYQTEPEGGEQCSNCRYYVEDRNGDGTGACAIVEGTIEPSAWCASYVAYEAGTTTSG